jgi:hypothetical protein
MLFIANFGQVMELLSEQRVGQKAPVFSEGQHR